MSFDPASLPGRVEPKTMTMPSQDSEARLSLPDVLIVAPRLTGVGHGADSLRREAA
jgi:hypothetical protein